jgi:hypothetical protein
MSDKPKEFELETGEGVEGGETEEEMDNQGDGERKVVRRRAWNQEEDDALLAAVLKVTNSASESWGASDTPSTMEWSEIVRLLPGRTKKQCRERWDNKVNPGISAEEWTTDEILRVFLLHKKHGNKWRAIAADMPGRTALQCRNCYHSQQSALRKKFPHIFAELEDGRATSSSLASAVESMRPEYSDGHTDGRRKRRSTAEPQVADFGLADHLDAEAGGEGDEHAEATTFGRLGPETGALLPQVEALMGTLSSHIASQGNVIAFEGAGQGTEADASAVWNGAEVVAAPAESSNGGANATSSAGFPAHSPDRQEPAGARADGKNKLAKALSPEALDAAVALLSAGETGQTGHKRKREEAEAPSNASKKAATERI